MHTITQEQAEQRVQQYFHAAFAVLPPKATAENFDTAAGQCQDPTDNGPPGRVEPTTDYQIHGLAPTRYGAYFDQLKRWATGRGFDVLTDKRQPYMFLEVENPAYGFSVTMQSNDGGELYLGATSPCVWPDGTPPPSVTGG
jgi:hypothetical protein